MVGCVRLLLPLARISIAGAMAFSCLNVGAGTLHAAVLPAFESDRASLFNSYLATLINDTDVIAKNCRIEIEQEHKLELHFWTTDQTHNFPTGERNVPADLWPRSAQTFLFNLKAYAQPLRVEGPIFPIFVCDGREPAIRIEGVNSIKLEAFNFSQFQSFTRD